LSWFFSQKVIKITIAVSILHFSFEIEGMTSAQKKMTEAFKKLGTNELVVKKSEESPFCLAAL
jgi:hypothetical protein